MGLNQSQRYFLDVEVQTEFLPSRQKMKILDFIQNGLNKLYLL